MLPDCPSLKGKLLPLLVKTSQRKLASEGRGSLTALIARQRQFEGRGSVIIREDGTKDQVKMRRFATTFEMNVNDVPTISETAWLKKFEAAAAEITTQDSRAFIDSISEAADSVGNTLDVAGQPLSVDHVLAALDKMHISFSPDGKAQLPTFMCGTKVAKSLENILSGIDSNLEASRKMQLLIERKRTEWIDREASRKLVG